MSIFKKLVFVNLLRISLLIKVKSKFGSIIKFIKGINIPIDKASSNETINIKKNKIMIFFFSLKDKIEKNFINPVNLKYSNIIFIKYISRNYSPPDIFKI